MTNKKVLVESSESRMVQLMLDAMENPSTWFTPFTHHTGFGRVDGTTNADMPNMKSVERS